VSSSYLGGLQLDALRAACSVWPRGTLDPDLHAPLSIAVPALLLSGELDPITPPRYAERTLAGARQALHLVVPGHGHGQLLEPCVNRIVAAFLAQHSIGDLDTRCVDTLQPAPFFLTFTGTAP
jgi:pimeloyl-ACP methyl ester carboxylesterase